MVPRVFLQLTLNLATIKPKYSPEDAQKIDFQRDKGRNGYIVMPSSLTDALATTFSTWLMLLPTKVILIFLYDIMNFSASVEDRVQKAYWGNNSYESELVSI